MLKRELNTLYHTVKNRPPLTDAQVKPITLRMLLIAVSISLWIYIVQGHLAVNDQDACLLTLYQGRFAMHQRLIPKKSQEDDGFVCLRFPGHVRQLELANIVIRISRRGEAPHHKRGTAASGQGLGIMRRRCVGQWEALFSHSYPHRASGQLPIATHVQSVIANLLSINLRVHAILTETLQIWYGSWFLRKPEKLLRSWQTEKYLQGARREKKEIQGVKKVPGPSDFEIHYMPGNHFVFIQ
jgi:hypothetical protein